MMVSTGIVPVPPITGGAIESHVFALANALADRGALVHYIGDIRSGTPRHYNVRYHPVHSPIRSFPLPFPGWIISHLVGGSLSAKVSYGITLQEKIDVAHFHEETRSHVSTKYLAYHHAWEVIGVSIVGERKHQGKVLLLPFLMFQRYAWGWLWLLFR